MRMEKREIIWEDLKQKEYFFVYIILIIILFTFFISIFVVEFLSFEFFGLLFIMLYFILLFIFGLKKRYIIIERGGLWSGNNTSGQLLDKLFVLKQKNTFIFEDFIYTKMYKYAAMIAKRITYSTAKATFGLNNESNIGWSFYPAMQAAHILFPQFNEGRHLSLVPIGIDQDPFIRLTRDVAVHKDFNFEKPAAIHAKFIPSLHGNPKMSSSKEGSIYLSDSAKDVESKISKYAFSGGGATIKEHKEKGGNPDIDVSYQYLKMFFEPDDNKLMKIYNDYKSGRLLTSELKQILIDKINKFLKEHQNKREKAKDKVNDFILRD